MAKRNREKNRAAQQRQKQLVQRVAGVQETAGMHTGPGNQRWDALDELREAAEVERAAGLRRDIAVRAARSQGASWTSIAGLLGVSPQAVQQRYGRTSSARSSASSPA